MNGLRWSVSRLIPDTYIFISALVVALVVTTWWASWVGADPQTRESELMSLSDMYHATLMQRRPAGYYRMLNSSDPATRALNEDPGIRLMYFDSRGLPTYYGTYNTFAAYVIKTDQVWPGGLTGYDLNGVGTVAGEMAMWDGGAVRLTHQEFEGRVAQMDTAVTTHYHSTHVAGTMVATGVDPDAKGMSYRAPLHAYEWDDDFSEMAAAATQGLRVSNHSYGTVTGWGIRESMYWYGDWTVDGTEDYRFGFYDDDCQAMDEIMYNAPYYLIVRAAGNDADDTAKSGSPEHYHLVGETWVLSTDYHQDDSEDDTKEDTLPPDACAKNILTVGAIGKDYGSTGHPIDVTHFTSSGPTDDGRIKPDVVALGQDLTSPSDESDTSYYTLDGTSMASPCVAGSVNLLNHYYEDLYGKLPLASSMKALVIHTAQKIRHETPPSARGGWGKMDTRRAAELIAGDGEGGGIMEATLQQGETHRYYFEDATSSDRFTIAWTDPPGTPVAPAVDPTTTMLVNDLDMRVRYTKSGSYFEPIIKDWSAAPPRPNLSGDNARDNVERIDSHGVYGTDDDLIEVTVTHKGTLSGGEQTYSLVWSGVTPRQPLPPAGGPTAISVVDMGHPDSAPLTSTFDNHERGIYFTAIKDFDLDAVGFKMNIPSENTLTARLYAVDGTARISELAAGTATSHSPGDIFHYVQLNATLEACQQYELAFDFEEAIGWDMWNSTSIDVPYDAGGVVRIRGGQWNGNSSTPVIAHFALAGRPLGDVTLSDLTPPGASWGISTDAPGERGIFVTAEQTATLSAIRWGASFPSYSSNPVEASVYEADGITRGALIARTNTTIFSFSTGTKMFTIPINAALVEGRDYNLAVTFEPSWFQVKSEDDVTLPYGVDGLLRVVDGEAGGDPTDSLLTHFGVNWNPGAGGTPHDLGHPTGMSRDFTSSAGNPGMFVTSLIDQQVYSIGWMADVPEGSTIGVRVYKATPTTHPALITEGEVISGASGMRWHDIPVAVTLEAGEGYSFEVVISLVDAWESWDDRVGLPYQSYGVIEVVDGHFDGNPGGRTLPHLRINLCNPTLTGVADGPATPPSFSLSAPYPNPASERARVDYQLDEASQVSITVYDVAGRRVATLLDGVRRPAGAGTAWLDASTLPTGIYFVQMRSAAQTATRKMTIVK